MFSVIIPTFNRQQTIRRAINSVFAQSFTDFELIVVDDGSSDGTSLVMASYSDERLKYIRHAENIGQNAALNTGVKSATRQYVAFLDSDDEWHPMFLERVFHKFSLNPSFGCVYTLANIVDTATGKIEVAENFEVEGDVYTAALSQGYVSHMITLVASRGLLFEVGLFDEEFEVCQDDDICIRLAKVTHFGLIQEPLAMIYSDAGDQISRNLKKHAYGLWKLTEKFSQDILLHCGSGTISNYYERCGDLFWLSRNYRNGFKAYRRAYDLAASPRLLLKCVGIKLGISPTISLKLRQGLSFLKIIH